MKTRNRDRVVDAMGLTPWTSKDLAKALMLDPENVRTTLRRLEVRKIVKRQGFAARKPQGGAAAFLWVVSAPSLAPARLVGRFCS